MNHGAKKVQATAAGYPIVNGALPKPLTSYPLRKLRKGTKHPESPSDFRPSTQAAKDFEKSVLNDGKSKLTILKEDILEEVVPVLSRARIGMEAHGDALRQMVVRTASFAILSAHAIFTSLKVVAQRAVSRG